MESKTSVNAPQQASNYDEIFMQHSLIFADSLKDLRNLRKQLYSAAEYFELTYGKDEHKQLVVETLHDYVTKALINTVDHLGSVAYKVNNFLDDKINEVSETEFRFFCIQRRLQTYQELIDREGLLQQSLVIKTPKYHKRYIIPVKDTMHSVSKCKPTNNSNIVCPEDYLQQHKKATTVKPHSPLFRKGHSRVPLSSTESSSGPGTFSFTRVGSSKEPGKRAVSSLPFPLKRSGSDRSITRSCSNGEKRSPSEPRRSTSMYIHPEIIKTKVIQQYPKKSKGLFKALLSIHRSRKESVPSRFRDDN